MQLDLMMNGSIAFYATSDNNRIWKLLIIKWIYKPLYDIIVLSKLMEYIMSSEAIAKHFEEGKFYKTPFVEKRITHIPSNKVIHDHSDVEWMIAYKGSKPEDFKVEEIGKEFFYFQVVSITAYDENDNDHCPDSDLEYRNNPAYELEYDFDFSFELEHFENEDFMTRSILVTDPEEEKLAQERIAEWLSQDAEPDYAYTGKSSGW